MNDDVLLSQIKNELAQNRPHPETWATALARCEENRVAAKSLYRQLRLEELRKQAESESLVAPPGTPTTPPAGKPPEPSDADLDPSVDLSLSLDSFYEAEFDNEIREAKGCLYHAALVTLVLIAILQWFLL
ncbi:MAG: hypothetical protein HQL57_05260 [Magnetococcales bacterium]|nr:hypothetical protein [Magnetococcales bacterium]MBF0156573.1 hypothetical protein [Magnetococcales bacterium]